LACERHIRINAELERPGKRRAIRSNQTCDERGTFLAGRAGIVMRILKVILFTAGAIVLFALVYQLGAESIVSALARIAWWQFALLCLIHGAAIAADAWAWRYTLPGAQPAFHKLFAARCAGDAANLITALSAFGGEAIKAWLLRHEVPYRESVPSLIVSKSAELVGQVLLFVIALAFVFGAPADFDPSLRSAMATLLLVQVIAVGGFVAVQLAGLIDKAGRVLSWAGLSGDAEARQLDRALRSYYRRDWRRFLLAIAFHFVGWLVGVVETALALEYLGLASTLAISTIIEALWSAVRFATFFVPGSLGPLEGANAAAFEVLGFGASAGLAFTLVRRARQAVWIAIGVIVLLAMRAGIANEAGRAGALREPGDADEPSAVGGPAQR
jgi:uncharacterized protein (TIRG00374 family)